MFRASSPHSIKPWPCSNEWLMTQLQIPSVVNISTSYKPKPNTWHNKKQKDSEKFTLPPSWGMILWCLDIFASLEKWIYIAIQNNCCYAVVHCHNETAFWSSYPDEFELFSCFPLSLVIPFPAYHLRHNLNVSITAFITWIPSHAF